MYQPIKFTKIQYNKIKFLIRREFGNVSLAKGIFLMIYGYINFVPLKNKNYLRKKYYVSLDKTKKGYYKK